MGVKGTTNFDYLDCDEITTDSVVIGTTPIPPESFDLLKYVTATYYEINQACDASHRVQNVTTTPYQLDSTGDGGVIVLDKADDGLALVLAPATGIGTRLKLYVKTTFTDDCTIKVTGDDIMKGYAILGTGDADNSTKFFGTAADTDTITLTGTTTGGIAGATIELTDIAANTWAVQVISSTDENAEQATPFSATV